MFTIAFTFGNGAELVGRILWFFIKSFILYSAI